MSTTLRAELSKKNPYWIPKQRYYELKHFCLQYPAWKKMRAMLMGVNGRPVKEFIFTGEIDDPTARCAEKMAYFSERIGMVELVAMETDAVLGVYILKGVTRGISYDILRMKENIPCSKDVYYELYRRFFWLLDEARA